MEFENKTTISKSTKYSELEQFERRYIANQKTQADNIRAKLQRGTCVIKEGHTTKYNPDGKCREIPLTRGQILRMYHALSCIIKRCPAAGYLKT